MSDTLETIEQYQEALKIEQEAHAATKQEFQDYKIEAEARLLKEKDSNPIKRVTVYHDGKTYRFNQQSVNIKGAIVSAEVAAEDEEYIESILAIEGQNILKIED